MSDSLVQVDIELLRQHPELPAPTDILARFAEHHAQSEARRKAHDELMQSDSSLDLEDFGALAASALGTSENILDEEAPAYSEDPPNNGDTLPEHEAASDDQPADEPAHDSEEAASEEAELADEEVDVTDAADEADSIDGDATETMEASETLNAEPEPEPEPEPEAAPKKRTRKRKSKKKKS